MPGIDDVFWDQLDARMAASLMRAPARPRPTVGAPGATVGAPGAKTSPETKPRPADMAATDRHEIADWTGLVDTISAAGAAAQEQTVANETLAGDLRRALVEIETYKALVAQVQAQALAQAREIQALADARIEAIQARADARVQRAEERAEVADLRANVVEEWLTKFEQASRDLIPAPRTDGRRGRSAAA
jgi:hypothetical protein